MTCASAEMQAVNLPAPSQLPRRPGLPSFLDVPWGVRNVVLLAVAWFGLQILLGIGLVYLGPFVPQVAVFLTAVDKGEIGASFVLNLAGIVIGFALVGATLMYYRVGWQAVGWRRVSVWRTLGYLVGILVVFLILANLAFSLLKAFVPGFDADQAQVNEFTEGAAANRSLALIALVLLPPIFEETIFRGFVFPALAKRIGIFGGALLSSVLFGLAHGQANIFVYTAILGVLLSLMYRRLGSIIPGIALHMLNNYLAFLAMTGK